MAESFSRWESDPLFSAAEVVQDSADRMESVYRTLLHEQCLVQEGQSDAKLLSSLQYHRRDLTTSLETTRWQLEDFEREVNLAALSDELKSREIAILKHKQFIGAIREQILQVERSVQDSIKEDHQGNPLWMSLNEQDKDMLTSFLSGGNVGDHGPNYVTENSIMRRFLDSNTDNDEIIELKPEEVKVLPMNGKKNADIVESSRKHVSWKIGSGSKHDSNGSALFQGSGGKQELENTWVHDLEFGGLGAKYYAYQNRIRGSAWGFLRNLWLANNSKGSFTKKRKDGEITGLMENTCERMTSSTGSGQQGTFLECVMSAMQFKCFMLNPRRLQTSQYLIPYNRFPIKLIVVIMVIVSIIGLLGFWMA